MTYRQWVPILEKETDCTVVDPDGSRRVWLEKKQAKLMDRAQAMAYFRLNTVKMGPIMQEQVRAVLQERIDTALHPEDES